MQQPTITLCLVAALVTRHESRGEHWVVNNLKVMQSRQDKQYGTLCKTTIGLSGNRLSQTWKKLQTLLIKMFLRNLIWDGVSFILLWPIATQWSHGRLGPRWALFLHVPSVCVGSLEVVVFTYFLAFFNIFFRFVQKKVVWIGASVTSLQASSLSL